jgi:hypothetical protein
MLIQEKMNIYFKYLYLKQKFTKKSKISKISNLVC